MEKINLREFYPHYQQDSYVEVPDDVAALLRELKSEEAAYRLRTYRNKAHYSLDRKDGIEHSILFVVLGPCEIYEQKLTTKQLYTAIASLPDKQAKRIYAYYFMGLGYSAIAKAEGVSVCAVFASIERGLRNLQKFAKSFH